MVSFRSMIFEECQKPLLSTFLRCFQQITKTYHSKNYLVRFSALLLVQNELWVAYITHYTVTTFLVTNFKMDVKRKWKPAKE
jgi:hypothetical protein